MNILILFCALRFITLVNSNYQTLWERPKFQISNKFKSSNSKFSSSGHSRESNPNLKNSMKNDLPDLSGSIKTKAGDEMKFPYFHFKRFPKKKSKRHLRNINKLLGSSRLNQINLTNDASNGDVDDDESNKDDINKNTLGLKPIKYEILYERRKRLAERKRDKEGMMEVCDNKLCNDRGICRNYMTADSKVQLCSCFPGYEGDVCQLAKPDPNRFSLPEKGKKLNLNSLLYNNDKHDRLISDKSNKLIIDDDYVEYYEYSNDGSHKLPPSSSSDCDSMFKLLFRREPPPVTLIVLLICCLLIAIVTIIAMVLVVDGDRRVLLERYELISRLGYEVERPDVGFVKLLGHRLMFMCCCLCHCCPWIDCCYCLQSIQNFETDIQLAAAKNSPSVPPTPTTPRSKTITWAPTTPRR